jgi:hypothetical protein
MKASVDLWFVKEFGVEGGWVGDMGRRESNA